MKQALILLLVILLFMAAAYAAVVNSGAPTQNLAIGDGGGQFGIWEKMFFLFNLPDIGGGTVTQAILYVNVFQPTNNPLTVRAHTTWANVSWTESTDAGTMNGYAIGPVLDTKNMSSQGVYTFNVTGDSTKGVIAAYNNGTKVTCILRQDTFTNPIIVTSTGLRIGQEPDDYVGVKDRHDSVYYPYLQITYTSGTTRKIAGVVVNGNTY